MSQRAHVTLLSVQVTILLTNVNDATEGSRSGSGGKTLSHDGYGRVTLGFRGYAADCSLSPTRCFERPVLNHFGEAMQHFDRVVQIMFTSCNVKKLGARNSATGNTTFITRRSSNTHKQKISTQAVHLSKAAR